MVSLRKGTRKYQSSNAFYPMETLILKRMTLFPSNPQKLCPFSYFSSTSLPLSNQPSLISTAVSILTHHRSKSRWTHLRSLLSSADNTLTASDFSQIILHLKSNPHLALRFFNFTLRNNSLCSHSPHSYSAIIHILSRARLKAKAQSIIWEALASPKLFDHGNVPLKLFETLVKTYRVYDSAPFVFDLLIKSCIEQKKIDASIGIVRMLRSRGISPQIHTCNLLISSVSRCKGSYAGYGIFREVFGLEDNDVKGQMKGVVSVRPNVHTFNALMVEFYRDGDMEMVEETWGEMGRFGCAPNCYSYSVLMTVFSEGGKMTEAEKLWEEMTAKEIRPDLVAYNTIIGGFCTIGEIEKAEEHFREMGLSGVESSCVTYEHLINGYCKVGNVDSAILVYKDMYRKDFRPEASTIEVLIGGLCERKRVFEAFKIMKFVMTDANFCPSRKSYEFLILGLCEDGKMEEALKLQAKMVSKGFEPNSKIYGAFVDGYMKLGNEEMAATLRSEMTETQRQQEED